MAKEEAMAEQRRHDPGAAGAARYFIVLIVLVIGVSIYVASQVGPVYNAKWELEDKMEELMHRFAALDEEGIFTQLQEYAEKNNLPFNAYEDCTFTGDKGEQGEMTCTYVKEIKFPRYTYKMKIVAHKIVSKIPFTSF
jgi:hypothetical protein